MTPPLPPDVDGPDSEPDADDSGTPGSDRSWVDLIGLGGTQGQAVPPRNQRRGAGRDTYAGGASPRHPSSGPGWSSFNALSGSGAADAAPPPSRRDRPGRRTGPPSEDP